MLRQQVDGEMVLQHGDVRMFPHGFDQCPFDFGARKVFVVEDAMFGVAPLAVKLEPSVGSFIETRTPFEQVGDQLRRTAHDQFDGCRVAFPCTADQRIVDVFLECIGRIGYRTDAALGIVGVAFVHSAFGHDGDMTVCSGLEGKSKPCRARTDD